MYVIKKRKMVIHSPKLPFFSSADSPKCLKKAVCFIFLRQIRGGKKSYSFNLCQGKEELGDKNFMNRTYNVQSTLITWGK